MVETICFYLQNLIFESPKPTTEQGKKKPSFKKSENIFALFQRKQRESISMERCTP